MKKSIVSAVLVMVAIVFVVVHFVGKTRDNEMSVVNDNMIGIAKANAAAVRQTFLDYISSLNVAARFIEKYDDFRSPEVISVLAKIAAKEKFERIAINFPDGKSYTSDGHVVDFSSLESAVRAASGEIFVEDVIEALIDGALIVNVYVPMYNKNVAPGTTLRLAVKTDSLSEIFDKIFWNDEGYYFLIDGNGRSVAASNPELVSAPSSNHFEMIKTFAFASGFSAEKMTSDAKNSLSGFARYSRGGIPRYAYYVPVGINNWMMLMVIPESVVENHVNINFALTMETTVYLIGIVLCVFIYIYILQRRAQNEAKLNEKCFRVLAEHTGKMIFKWNIKKNSVEIFAGDNAHFVKNLTIFYSPEEAVEAGQIFPEDTEAYIKIYETVKQAQDIDEAKFRYRASDGGFRWCRLSSVIVRDEDDEPYMAIGSLEDIDDEEREKERLRLRASTDALTGFYNKISTELLVTETLTQSHENDMHALLCLDIDNFKNVNDTLGHLFGDKVLTDVAENIRKLFRSSDILGRFGGDEFVVLLKNVSDINFVEERANLLNEALRIKYHEGEVELKISASIGISIFPSDAGDYKNLLLKSDEALYKAKQNGKDRFVLYSATRLLHN